MNVENINLFGNRINSIEDNTFANLKNLKTLWLEENDLETLSPGAFFGLDSLTYLRLDGNRLMMLQEDVFNRLSRQLRLGVYNLRYNRTKDNPLKCDADLCWLKKEELNGNVTWASVYFFPQGQFTDFLPDVQTA